MSPTWSWFQNLPSPRGQDPRVDSRLGRHPRAGRGVEPGERSDPGEVGAGEQEPRGVTLGRGGEGFTYKAGVALVKGIHWVFWLLQCHHLFLKREWCSTNSIHFPELELWVCVCLSYQPEFLLHLQSSPKGTGESGRGRIGENNFQRERN